MADDVLTWILDKVGFRVYRSQQTIPQQGAASTTSGDKPPPAEALLARRQMADGIDVETMNRASNFYPPPPPIPKFTDIGQAVAKLAPREDTQTQILETGIMKDIPFAGPVFSFLGFSGLEENAAGLSPQQMTWLAKEITNPSTGQINPQSAGHALAQVEGKMGTKQIVNDEGDYVTVGGVGLGGPGWSNLDVGENPVRLPARTLIDSPARTKLSPSASLPDWRPGDHPHIIQQDTPDPADPLPEPGDDPSADGLEPIALHRGERPIASYNPGAVRAAFDAVRPDLVSADLKGERAARQEFAVMQRQNLTKEPILTPDWESQGDQQS